MQIVIPMAGLGDRFQRAGYATPKPLIVVDGRPVLAHVIDMFPGEADFIFICNRNHLDDPGTDMRAILLSLCPSARIVAIEPHKLGPVHTLLSAQEFIDPDGEVTVNYCDFTCYWDWPHFKRFVRQSACHGAIAAYRGFHPHMLGSTSYAYLRERGGWVTDVQEKRPFTPEPMEEYASSGTYYFRSGAAMLHACALAREQSLQVAGEYYVSLAYKPLLARGDHIAVYPIQHFMQWGTPEDLGEYQAWSNIFRRLTEADAPPSPASGTAVLSLAGRGQRFQDEGYQLAKPLIPVGGKPMSIQSAAFLPPTTRQAFVIRADMPGCADLEDALQAEFPHAVVAPIPGLTQGQACTALLGLDAIERQAGQSDIGPIVFGCCDGAAIYDAQAYRCLLADPGCDIILWGARYHPSALRRPEWFGWIDAQEGHVRRVSVKRPLESPAVDPVITGIFTFRHAHAFRHAVQRLMARDGRVNGEFYIDSCINDAIDMGLNVRLFEVDAFVSWGTPDDLRTFEYWQSCFHKWPSHPYSLERDHCVAPQDLPALLEKCRAQVPFPPEIDSAMTPPSD